MSFRTGAALNVSRQSSQRNLKMVIPVGLAFALMATQATAPQSVHADKSTLTRAQAEQIARSRVTDGIIRSAELEHEHGKQVWSFDISRPGQTNLTELQIDALTGAVVSTTEESPKDEAAEARSEHHKKH
jgi:uncharacterized membrane protein YkoI